MNEKKRIPLFVGEGPNRVEVGTVEVEHREGGTVFGNMDITNPEHREKLFGAYLAKPKVNPLIRDQGPELSFGKDVETS
jgi:hypothetical protein